MVVCSVYNGGASSFCLGAIVQTVWGRKTPIEVQGRNLRLVDEVPQKLKQFADIAYRFRSQKRSIFGKNAQSTL